MDKNGIMYIYPLLIFIGFIPIHPALSRFYHSTKDIHKNYGKKQLWKIDF